MHLTYYVLTILQIWRKSCTSYCNFYVYEKKKIKKKNMKTIKWTLKTHISVMAGWICWNGMCSTPMDLPQKKWCSFVQVLSSYRCAKTVFFWFLYNTRLSVTYPHWLHLATRHTIMRLDVLDTFQLQSVLRIILDWSILLDAIHHHQISVLVAHTAMLTT